ncbi:MAG: hypothetical protein AAF639_31520 [Chloroflexota bacterium]
MAKTKKKKSRVRGGARDYSSLYRDGGPSPAPASSETESKSVKKEEDTAAPSKAVETAPAKSSGVDWQKDYGQVVQDLRTLIVVSIALFIVTIGAGYLF